jgi:hypothetical protein
LTPPRGVATCLPDEMGQQKEMWTETPVHNGKKGRPVNKDRFISKM